MIDRYAEKYDQFEFDSPGDRILRLTFNKPETYNSLDNAGHRQLTYIWRDIDEDPDVSCVILRSEVSTRRRLRTSWALNGPSTNRVQPGCDIIRCQRLVAGCSSYDPTSHLVEELLMTIMRFR